MDRPIPMVVQSMAKVAAPTIRKRKVRIQLREWIFVCVLYVCCVGSGLCDDLITRSEGSERVCA
jgi:hypothetical protein